MSENENFEKSDVEGIYSKVLRAGRRTYFFDVRETRAGDYYLTITESKKNSNEDGSFYFKKHKIYLYKEDFQNFKEYLDDATNFIMKEKGEEVISDRHQSDYYDHVDSENDSTEEKKDDLDKFNDISFEDI